MADNQAEFSDAARERAGKHADEPPGPLQQNCKQARAQLRNKHPDRRRHHHARVNLRHNFLPCMLAALAVALCTSVVFEISSLDRELAAQPLEMLLSLSGAVLLTPVFLPEQIFLCGQGHYSR